jgi:hypothetical protein
MANKKNKRGIKIVNTEDKEGNVTMEISFHFPILKTTVKAKNLAEAQKKIKNNQLKTKK